MTNLPSVIDRLERPRLLIQAARAGAMEYCRTAHLRRVLGPGQAPPTDTALRRLMEIESDLNDQRVAGYAGYSIVRHVDVLIALLAEARMARHCNPVAATDAPTLTPAE
ncbi:DUF6477 family protein [Aquicoccus sp.]|uniref:DUF6477 family protein n=1 Tax=Aquicoccus sp. TaxID=2055851 RepID=UPI00356352CD